MKKGFFVFKENVEDTIAKGYKVLCDGEELYMIRYKPGQKVFYPCKANVSVYDVEVPVVDILKDAKQAILSNSELVSYHGDTLQYTEGVYNVITEKTRTRDIILMWKNEEFSFSIKE